MNNAHLKAMLASYGRSVIGAAVALYASGVTDPQTLLYSLIGAVVPVAMRALNPSDPSFGKVPDVKAVEDAMSNVKVVKPTPKKKAAPAVKKATSPKNK